MPKDWYEWHDLYDTEPVLQQRLKIVQEYIAYSLNASPDGAIRVVSVCAGDGRDLLGTLKNHPRAKDVSARLVELNPQLVERGRATIESLGLTKQIEFINGDATLATNYVGAVLADIAIADIIKNSGVQALVADGDYTTVKDAVDFHLRQLADYLLHGR
jgi:Putative methyltransferase